MLFFAAENPGGLPGLFENNLLNWALLVVLLVILWNRIMPAVFASRKDKIDSALKDATASRAEGQAFLLAQQERVSNASREAEQILVEAKSVAQQMKEQITQQTRHDGEDISRKTKQQIETEIQMAKAELRSQAAVVAMRLAEAALPGAITSSTRDKLQADFVKQLDSIEGKR